jgi:hypothetical protein
VALLKPRLIVKMTADFRQLYGLDSKAKVLGFRRSNGDRRITASGLADLEIISRWAEGHRQQ